METGTVGILSVGAGDVRISFDKNDPAERIRAARIVADMLRRGYALLVEVERRGKKSFQRAKAFRGDTCEYIIADLDGSAAEPEDTDGAENYEHAREPKATGKARGKVRDVRVPAEKSRAVAVARSAGG